MRLLTHDQNGNIVPKTFDGVEPPPYAILSHTWLPDNSEEVSLQDLQASSADHKPGYDKILFCAKQAAADGLRHFWIDTCSVDQTSSAELTEAINSMFRWYQRAAKCYVYLTDVPDSTPNKRILCGSRWFTRGWTLQELIAPKMVEFFAADGLRLGDRPSLETSISEATGMSIGALRGYPLSDFSVEERFRWAANRQTKKPEDKAYSLLGIFNVSMPAIYGEGEEKAKQRLREQIDRQRSFRPDFGATDNPEASRLSASTTTRTPAYYLPFSRNRRFVGRQDELQELRQKLLIDKECQKIAIVGLGGIGKTQIALEFSQSIKREKLDYSIFWVLAVSLESFEQACTDIARILQIPQAADVKQDVKVLVKQHLSDQLAGKWLLIVDNADDMSVMFGAGSSSGVVDFLPENDDGVTVFTSRRGEVAESLVGNDVLEVGKMSEDEAVIFLTASLARKTEHGPIKQLVADLDCLPLAIAQAAAYINTNKIAVSKYLDLIRNTDADVIAVMSREFRDSTRYKQSSNAVATTWVVSFKQILQENADAADLLSFISCIEWKSIPRSLLPTIGPEARGINTIGTICSYGFLTRRESDDMFDMHRLVHLAIRIWLIRERCEAEVRGATIKRVATIFPFNGYEQRELRRMYLPHALRLVVMKENSGMEEKVKLTLKVASSLSEDGRVSQAVMLLEQSCQWIETDLPGNCEALLASQYTLAKAYTDDGQADKAVKLLEYVDAVNERLPEDRPSRSATKHELSRAYLANGQSKEAIKLLKHIDMARSQLPEEHRDRLATKQVLGSAYFETGQIKEAIEMLKHVEAVQNELPDDHPDRLATKHELARAYQANGQIEEAVTLLEHVVKVREKLAEDHPELLKSQRVLAGAYQANGQIEEAATLLDYVVAAKKRRYAESHPSRIVSEEALDNVLQSTHSTL